MISLDAIKFIALSAVFGVCLFGGLRMLTAPDYVREEWRQHTKRRYRTNFAKFSRAIRLIGLSLLTISALTGFLIVRIMLAD